MDNQNNLTSEDSLQIKQVEPGRFELEWDKNDPRWSWLNDLTEEQIQTIVLEAIDNHLEHYDPELR